jgi:hypothetical protein
MATNYENDPENFHGSAQIYSFSTCKYQQKLIADCHFDELLNNHS